MQREKYVKNCFTCFNIDFTTCKKFSVTDCQREKMQFCKRYIVLGIFGLSAGTGCAPAGYEGAAFTSINWPKEDQSITSQQKVEIERHLKALKYLNEPADGILTKNSRSAIRMFQTDIGAPATGFVSVPLLDALKFNSAPLSAEQSQKIRKGPVKVAQTAPSQKPARSASNAEQGEQDGGGTSGGSGGSGAGAWN